MDNQPENKSIQLDTDYENHAINMKFSNNLTDDQIGRASCRERVSDNV